MTRGDFEALLAIPDKLIRADIKLSLRRPLAPALVADDVVIENSDGFDLRLSVSHNPETGATTFNVHIPGVGPICRLDVDGPAHRPAGRSHKHALQSPDCPRRNLPDGVVDRPELSGQSVVATFAEFCRLSHLTHAGSIVFPSDWTP